MLSSVAFVFATHGCRDRTNAAGAADGTLETEASTGSHGQLGTAEDLLQQLQG